MPRFFNGCCVECNNPKCECDEPLYTYSIVERSIQTVLVPVRSDIHNNPLAQMKPPHPEGQLHFSFE